MLPYTFPRAPTLSCGQRARVTPPPTVSHAAAQLQVTIATTLREPGPNGEQGTVRRHALKHLVGASIHRPAMSIARFGVPSA